MQHHHHNDDSNLYVFFIGAVFNLFANTEAAGLMDYALKAAIGGMIWMLWKVLADFFSHKLKTGKKNADN